jgi:hypothetical protein
MDAPLDHDERLRKLAEEGVCPNCGNAIGPGKRQVRGSGVFCSLGCVAEYNAMELMEQHRRILAAFERHRRS